MFSFLVHRLCMQDVCIIWQVSDDEYGLCLHSLSVLALLGMSMLQNSLSVFCDGGPCKKDQKGRNRRIAVNDRWQWLFQAGRGRGPPVLGQPLHFRGSVRIARSFLEVKTATINVKICPIINILLQLLGSLGGGLCPIGLTDNSDLSRLCKCRLKVRWHNPKLKYHWSRVFCPNNVC